MAPIIYIIYNADSTLRGKLKYAYNKLTKPATSCAACDLTHAGLHLTESAEWSATKKKIGADVQQLHRDELDQGVCPVNIPWMYRSWLIGLYGIDR